MNKAAIIYNPGMGPGTSFYQTIERFLHEAASLSLELIPFPNDAFLYEVGESCFHLERPSEFQNLQFVLFYDKDVLLAKAMEDAGFPVYNPSRAIRICDSKIKTHLSLSSLLPMPPAIFSPLRYFEGAPPMEFLQKVHSHFGKDIIIKEERGSLGEQVYLSHSLEETKKITAEIFPKPYFFQKFIESSRGRDLRILLVGEKILGAMERCNEEDFRSNISLGGKTKVVCPSKEETQLALAAHRALGLTFSGVDLLYGETGPLVCEVNASPFFLGFETATGISVAKEILQELLTLSQNR